MSDKRGRTFFVNFGEVIKILKNSTTEIYDYDIDGNITKHIIDDKDMGKTEYRYKYNVRNLPVEITTPIGSEYLTYDKAGRITLKENSHTGTEKKYTYFPGGAVKDILTFQNNKVVYSENYSYDKNGNKVYENLNGDVSEYYYDGMSRLKRAIKNNKITEYEFDSFNNISKEYELVGNRINIKSYFYDKNNRLLLSEEQNSVTQYQYDNAGNMTKKSYSLGGATNDLYYKYDGYNRLSEFEGNNIYAEYTYNPDGLRETKTMNGKRTRFMYDGANVAGELTSDNYYIYYRATELMGYTSFKGDTYYYRQDSHGNVTAILDITGNEIKNYSYNAYGNKESFTINPEGNNTILYQWKAETDKIHNPFGYCGEYADGETGLIYLRNRYYDASVGRFVSEDTHWNLSNMIYGDKDYKDEEIKIPDTSAIMQSSNLYAYCMNNPMKFADPSGEIADWVILALYGYAQTVITSPDLQYDIQMLSYDISHGDYVSAAFGIVDILAPGFSGSKMVPKFIKKYFDDVVNWISGVKTKNIEDLISAKSLTSNHSKGARWIPNNLKESLAMETVLSNPSGKTIVGRDLMKDSRWLGSDGWVKKAQNVNGVEIHYNYNEITGKFDDFKFK